MGTLKISALYVRHIFYYIYHNGIDYSLLMFLVEQTLAMLLPKIKYIKKKKKLEDELQKITNKLIIIGPV